MRFANLCHPIRFPVKGKGTEFNEFELRRKTTHCRFKFEPPIQSKRLRKNLNQ